MSETPSEAVEGVEQPAESAAAEPAPPPTEEEEAAHAEFLQTYEPVLTRLPQALADERAEQTAADEAAQAVEEQAELERSDLAQRAAEQQAQAEAEQAAYRAEHYPESVTE